MADVNLEAACLPQKHVNFVGRTDLLEEVVRYVKTGHRLVVLSGPPGYGKSAATITIGNNLAKQGLCVLFFSLKGLKEDITLYDVSVLILETLGTIASAKPVLQLQQLLKALPRKTILILDNTENVQKNENASFLEFLKTIGESANNLCTLVTTTVVLEQPMCLPFHVKAVPLKPLDDEESMQLFKKYVDKDIPRAQAKQLCEACMGIPLFLEIAASQVRNGVDISLLIQELQSNPQALLVENDVYCRCMKVFFSRLLVSLRVILAHLAVFPTSFTFEEARSVFEGASIDSLSQNKICQLMNHGLVKFDENKKTYQLHSVVQSVCKSKMDQVVFESYNEGVNEFINWHLAFLQRINVSFISHDGKAALDEYSSKKRNIIHALSLAIEQEHEHKPAIDVSTEVVNLLAKCLNIMEFDKIYWGFAEKAQAKGDKKRYSDCLTSLGFKSICFHGKENPDKPFDLLSEAYDLQKSLQLPETEETAHCTSKLGVCYARQGNVERGVELIEKGIEIRKRLLQSASSDSKAIREMLVCGGYCDLAMAYYTSKDFKAAVGIWETICLEGYQRIMNTHPFTASLLQYIGDAYHELRDYETAVDFKEQALDMRKHLLTTNHQDTARSFSSLAKTLEELGKPQEAVEMLQKALHIQSRAWASPEDISATEREITRIQNTDHYRRTMERYSIRGNRMASSGVSEMQPSV